MVDKGLFDRFPPAMQPRDRTAPVEGFKARVVELFAGADLTRTDGSRQRVNSNRTVTVHTGPWSDRGTRTEITAVTGGRPRARFISENDGAFGHARFESYTLIGGPANLGAEFTVSERPGHPQHTSTLLPENGKTRYVQAGEYEPDDLTRIRKIFSVALEPNS